MSVCRTDENDTTGVPRGMLHPSEKRRMSWDVFCMSLLFYSVFNVPLQLAFEDMDRDCSSFFTEQIWSFYADLFVDLAFIIDIFVNLRTAYWHPLKKQTLVTDQMSIFLNYAKGFMAIDLVGCVPIDLIMLTVCSDDKAGATTPNSLLRAPKILKQLRLLRALRLLRVSRFKRMVDGVRDQLRLSPGYIRVLQLIFFIFLALHFDACLMYWIGVNYLPEPDTEHQGQDTWVTGNTMFVNQVTGERNVAVIDLDKSQAYLISFYWAMTTIMTVGFGDVTPVTTHEGEPPTLTPRRWARFPGNIFAFGASPSVLLVMLGERRARGGEAKLPRAIRVGPNAYEEKLGGLSGGFICGVYLGGLSGGLIRRIRNSHP